VHLVGFIIRIWKYDYKTEKKSRFKHFFGIFAQRTDWPRSWRHNDISKRH